MPGVGHRGASASAPARELARVVQMDLPPSAFAGAFAARRVVSKTVSGGFVRRGFKSLPLRLSLWTSGSGAAIHAQPCDEAFRVAADLPGASSNRWRNAVAPAWR